MSLESTLADGKTYRMLFAKKSNGKFLTSTVCHFLEQHLYLKGKLFLSDVMGIFYPFLKSTVEKTFTKTQNNFKAA